jgi:hypothetical protein
MMGAIKRFKIKILVSRFYLLTDCGFEKFQEFEIAKQASLDHYFEMNRYGNRLDHEIAAAELSIQDSASYRPV